MYTILCLLLASLCMVGVWGRNPCPLPPSLWCSSPDIAKQCEVFDQCWRYHESDDTPVDITLYYESLCPDCRNFFNGQLAFAFKKVWSIMNLTLVPYGNARERQIGDKWDFECQHGKEECIGNLIDTCALHLTPNKTLSFLYIHCMEATSSQPESAARKCAKEFKVDVESIMKCANGDMGNSLEHQMALKTNALNPPHKYVPWVTINGVHTESMEREVERDLVKLICDTYKGEKPSGCGFKEPSVHKCKRQTFW